MSTIPCVSSGTWGQSLGQSNVISSTGYLLGHCASNNVGSDGLFIKLAGSWQERGIADSKKDKVASFSSLRTVFLLESGPLCSSLGIFYGEQGLSFAELNVCGSLPGTGPRRWVLISLPFPPDSEES